MGIKFVGFTGATGKGCGCCGGTSTNCDTCAIANVDHTFNYPSARWGDCLLINNGGIHSQPLKYRGSGQWSTDCLGFPGCASIQFTLNCNIGFKWQLTWKNFFNTTNCTGSAQLCGVNCTVTSCSPLILTAVMSNAVCPPYITGPDTYTITL